MPGASKKSKSYAQMLDELQQIIDWFESEAIDLDESIAKYKQANELIDDLEKYLKTAENKIKKVASK